MKKITSFFLFAIVLIIFGGCASILSKSTYPFTLNTDPSGVNVTIKDRKGMEIYNGVSPATVDLKASAGYLKKAYYTVHISSDGYDDQTLPINFKVDGWYFGNLLLGGLLGMLIVDPATGAMFKIEDRYMSVNLSKSNASIDNPSFKVYNLASIPREWKSNLVQIKP